jgi:glycosyltransferase involved in cell wall biosynthesis
MDSADLLLSHQLEAVIALAKNFPKVEVITSRARHLDLPHNVRVHNVNWNSEHSITSLIRFVAIFLKVLIAFRPHVIFSHMTDMQSAIISPLVRLLKIPHVLWYAHKTKSKYLAFTNLFVNNIVTSTAGSCPISSNKVIAIGQAIDPQNFYPRSDFSGKLNKFLHIGRLDPAKRTDYIIQTVAKIRSVRQEISLSLYGSIGNQKSRLWADELELFSTTGDNATWLTILPGVSRSEVPELISSHDLFIHAYLGSLDKTLVEATLMKIPVLTENPEYLSIFGSWSGFDSPSIQQEFQSIESLKPKEISSILEERYQIAYTHHSINHWISRVVEILYSNNSYSDIGDEIL